MGWQDWMVVSETLEEELQTERAIRGIMSSEDEDEVKGLCVNLYRQNVHMRKLLNQAVGRIAELDAVIVCSDT